MRIGPYEHAPTAPIVVFFVLFLTALLLLGSWQLHRAAEKQQILDAAAAAQQARAVPIEGLTDLEAAAIAHTRVTVAGSYIEDRQFLWDNRVHKGQAGYEVITPVQTDGAVVLVNRGWIAPGPTRQQLPSVALTADVESRSVNIAGYFSRPSKGLISGNAADVTDQNAVQWPVVVQYFDYDQISQLLGQPIIAGVLQPQNANTDLVPVRDDLLQPNWQPAAAIGPARHYSYAFQWFAMALALTVLYIVYNTKRAEPKS